MLSRRQLTSCRLGFPVQHSTMSRAAAEPTTKLAGRERLLLVEDDFMLRQDLAELLALEGYYVSSAADGIEALWRLERAPLPSAILLDLVLPKMNGISFREA